MTKSGLLSRSTNSPRPRLPEGLRIYAISDVHGCVDLLRQRLADIDADLERAPPIKAIQIFLGDYIDRGPNSKGVIDLMIHRSQSFETICLKGNHEVMALDVMQSSTNFKLWYQYGGLSTIMSYGIASSLNPDAEEQIKLASQLAAVIGPDHLRFLSTLKTSFSCGDYFFVHAGVRPDLPLDLQKEEDLLWIREEFLDSDATLEKFVVHGHTPVTVPDKRMNRINIDTGAYATGNLALLRLEGDSMTVL